jgi:hypothetical protein
MMSLQKEAKNYITANNLESLQELYSDLSTDENRESIDWQYLFKECYIHACLKKRQPIVDWLLTVYEGFDPISKIGLRHIFPYGRYLLAKR